MTTIGYDSIENILLSISDPNTWAAMTEVPWVNSPKINAVTSIYNEQGWWTGIAGWSTNVSWSASDYNTVAWSSGSINLPDWTTLSVTSWNTGNMSSTTYIYYDRDDNTVKTTTSSASSVWEKKILLCVAAPTTSWKDAEFQAFGCWDQSTFIHADNIAANTITGNEIAGNTITASEIASGAITTNKIAVWAVTSDEIEDWAVVASKIEAWAVTASKIDVSTLSAITAELWDVYVGTNSDSEIRIYTSWSQWRIYFYYQWDTVWYMIWDYISWVWDTVALTWGSGGSWNIALNGKVWCLNRLRIPVGDNLY